MDVLTIIIFVVELVLILLHLFFVTGGVTHVLHCLPVLLYVSVIPLTDYWRRLFFLESQFLLCSVYLRLHNGIIRVWGTYDHFEDDELVFAFHNYLFLIDLLFSVVLVHDGGAGRPDITWPHTFAVFLQIFISHFLLLFRGNRVTGVGDIPFLAVLFLEVFLVLRLVILAFLLVLLPLVVLPLEILFGHQLFFILTRRVLWVVWNKLWLNLKWLSFLPLHSFWTLLRRHVTLHSFSLYHLHLGVLVLEGGLALVLIESLEWGVVGPKGVFIESVEEFTRSKGVLVFLF